jgi:hypothetical protein
VHQIGPGSCRRDSPPRSSPLTDLRTHCRGVSRNGQMKSPRLEIGGELTRGHHILGAKVYKDMRSANNTVTAISRQLLLPVDNSAGSGCRLIFSLYSSLCDSCNGLDCQLPFLALSGYKGILLTLLAVPFTSLLVARPASISNDAHSESTEGLSHVHSDDVPKTHPRSRFGSPQRCQSSPVQSSQGVCWDKLL